MKAQLATLIYILVTGSYALAEGTATIPPQTIDSAEVAIPADSNSLFTTSVSLYLTSNYIFRGLTQTQNSAAVQGAFDLVHRSGFGVGGFISNVDMQLDAAPAPMTKTEADLYVTYNKSFGDHGFGAMAIWYNYVETPHYNTMEYSLYYRYSIAKIDIMQMPTYFGVKSQALYGRLSLNIPVSDKNTLLMTLGQTSFEDETLVQFKSYLDYKVGITHTHSDFTTEFSFTDTERKDLQDVKKFDQAFSVTLSRSF